MRKSIPSLVTVVSSTKVFFTNFSLRKSKTKIPSICKTFFTEENYCRLGLKEYSFTEVYNKLLDEFSKLDFDIYYITLYLSDESLYEKRLQREGKVEPKYAKFNVSNSIKQQNTYLEMSKEIKEKYSSIKTIEIDNSKDIEEVKKILKESINF